MLSPQLSYNIEEAMQQTGMGRSLLYAEIKAGRLAARKIARRTVILDTDLRAWLEASPRLRPGDVR
jgi:predicted DNA-binding transcriptional regulator AlpA